MPAAWKKDYRGKKDPERVCKTDLETLRCKEDRGLSFRDSLFLQAAGINAFQLLPAWLAVSWSSRSKNPPGALA